MFVILGATGHVGSACAHALLDRGEPVLAVVHDPDKAAALTARGAELAVVDIHNPDALRRVLRRGRRAFLLNPPAAPATDTDREERATVAAILRALDGSGLEKVVAESTMGAQAGEAIGDLSVLHAFEQGLDRQPIPAAINRAAYYFSNFDLQLAAIRDTGELHTMFPADFRLPMVAPRDLGGVAADRLTSSLDDTGVRPFEGPARYTPTDVARALAEALDRPVEVVVTSRDGWIEAFRAQGFSAPAAEAYARMTAATLDQPMVPERETLKGEVTLEAYVRDLVKG